MISATAIVELITSIPYLIRRRTVRLFLHTMPNQKRLQFPRPAGDHPDDYWYIETGEYTTAERRAEVFNSLPTVIVEDLYNIITNEDIKTYADVPETL